jgi:lipopolysaccharide exporter
MILNARKSFLKSTLVLAGGTTIGQALVALSSPIISRLYSPAQLGAYAVFSSLITIGAVIADLRYNQAIPLPATDEDGISLVRLSLGIIAVSVFIFFILSVVFGKYLSGMTGLSTVELLLVPIGILGASVYQTLNSWAIRKRDFTVVSKTRLTQAIGMVLSQVSIGFLGGGTFGLLVGDVIGRTSGCGSFLRKFLPAIRNGRSSGTGLSSVARRYYRFPLYNSGAAFINTLSLQLPFLLLPWFFTPESSGYFSLAYRSLGLPSMVIGQAIGQVLLGNAASVKENHYEIARTTSKVVLALFLIAAPVFAFAFVVGEPLFAFVFGANWSTAGSFAQVLAPWFLFWLVASPLSGLLVVREWQHISLVITAIELLARFFSIWIGKSSGSVATAVFALSISGIAISIISICVSLRAAYVPALRIASLLGLPTLGALCIVGLALAGRSFFGLAGAFGAILPMAIAFFLFRKPLFALFKDSPR